MKRALAGFLLALVAAGALAAPGDAIRIKDLGKFSGWRENALVGYGLVTGLAGTGDSPSNKATRQSIANLLSQFDFTIAPDQIRATSPSSRDGEPARLRARGRRIERDGHLRGRRSPVCGSLL